MVTDARAPHGEVDRDIVLNLPDRPDEGRAGLKPADIALIEEFGDRPHGPVARTLNDGVEKVIGMLLPGERNLSIEVYRSPIPSLREDPGKACPGAMLVIDPGNRTPNSVATLGPGFSWRLPSRRTPLRSASLSTRLVPGIPAVRA